MPKKNELAPPSGELSISIKKQLTAAANSALLQRLTKSKKTKTVVAAANKQLVPKVHRATTVSAQNEEGATAAPHGEVLRNSVDRGPPKELIGREMPAYVCMPSPERRKEKEDRKLAILSSSFGSSSISSIRKRPMSAPASTKAAPMTKKQHQIGSLMHALKGNSASSQDNNNSGTFMSMRKQQSAAAAAVGCGREGDAVVQTQVRASFGSLAREDDAKTSVLQMRYLQAELQRVAQVEQQGAENALLAAWRLVHEAEEEAEALSSRLTTAQAIVAADRSLEAMSKAMLLLVRQIGNTESGGEEPSSVSSSSATAMPISAPTTAHESEMFREFKQGDEEEERGDEDEADEEEEEDEEEAVVAF